MKEEVTVIEYAYIDEYVITKEKETVDEGGAAATIYRVRLTANFWRQDGAKQNIDRGGMSTVLLESVNTPISDNEVFAALTGTMAGFRDYVKSEVAGYTP